MTSFFSLDVKLCFPSSEKLPRDHPASEWNCVAEAESEIV